VTHPTCDASSVLYSSSNTGKQKRFGKISQYLIVSPAWTSTRILVFSWNQGDPHMSTHCISASAVPPAPLSFDRLHRKWVSVLSH